MQVYKAFLRIVKKNIVSVSIYFGIFIGIAIALSKTGMENETKQFSAESLTIAVENSDEGTLGKALTEHLGIDNEIVDMPTEQELLDKIYTRQIDYVLYIPKDFTSRFLAGERDNLMTDKKVPSSTTGAFADNQIESYLTTVGMYLDGGFSLEESVTNAANDSEIESTVEFLNGNDESAVQPGQYYLQYMPYVFICTIISAVGPVFMAFNEKDISARNKCSSMTLTMRNLQIIGASIVVALIDWGILTVVSVLLYPDYVLSIRGVLGGINSLIAVLLALSLAYTAAQLVKNESALNIASNTLGLALAFLGGIFVPMEIFGEGLLKVAHFLPTYWYVTANDTIGKMTQLSDFSSGIAHAFIIQTIYCIVILLIGMLISRMKIRE